MCPIAQSEQSNPRDEAASESVTLSVDEIRAKYDIPSAPVCLEALEYAHKELPASIFNHSLRTFLLADWHAPHLKTNDLLLAFPPPSPTDDRARSYERELLFVAAILHDIGTSAKHNGPQRFEVEGADAAAALLRKHSIPEADVYQVWLAIAIHTGAGIAERLGRLPYLVRTGVKLDFDAGRRAELGAEKYSSEIEGALPRLEVEKALGNAVVRQILEKEGKERAKKAPKNTWPGGLLEGHLGNPNWDAVNPAF